MKRVFLLFIFLISCNISWSQIKLSGTITDKKGETLVGANVLLKGTYLGTSCDNNGEFEFNNLKQGTYTIIASFIGFEDLIQEIELNSSKNIKLTLKSSEILTDEVIVKATRANEKAPVAFSNIKKKDFENQNLGQDIPYMLSITPSIVTSSDAGTGIGYSSFRLRGTDANRININVNGIPLNDPESHGVFWVNMPDFSTSVDNIQIQRGVGTSTNGAAAFGGTINFQTTKLNKKAYGEVNASAGSFNTLKTNICAGSGLLNKHFTFDVRLSRLKSDGFIDRAWSDLSSYYLSGAYYDKKNLLKVNVFSGEEETYQAWNGVPKAALDTNRTYNKYNYENEIDHYKQTHYQIHYSRELSKSLNFNTAFHYTKGEGYYEQFKEEEKLADYGLDNIIIGDSITDVTDLIRRKWLDNDFYGFTYSLNYKENKIDATIGGAWNKYEGDHFGRVIWMKWASNSNINHQWYKSTGTKEDFNIFTKINYQITDKLNLYGDLQYRKINYSIDGNDDDKRDLTQEHKFDFFNPKAGIYYNINKNQNTYFSFAVANREPNRGNYTDANPNEAMPISEKLYDYEAGYSFRSEKLLLSFNFYYMDYKDQLVLTGEINDVGSAIMKNIPNSYRTGIETTVGGKITNWLDFNANMTLSKNKVEDFTESVETYQDWSYTGQTTKNLGETDLAFSPSLIAGANLILKPLKNLSLTLSDKYVSEQFIDNTSTDSRKLDAYNVCDLMLNYSFKTKLVKNISLTFKINNLFNEEYETNAWVWRGYNNTKDGTENIESFGYFPQAGRNFLFGVKLRF